MPYIISTPKQNIYNSTGLFQEDRFGYFETVGRRREQEDALAWYLLQPQELAPADGTEPLNPSEIGHRLWTTYQLLDKPELRAGTTASTTIYDGKGHFITATVADAVAFVAVYDKQGEALGVVRLNSVTHKPDNFFEMDRIMQAGGTVELIDRRSNFYRVNGILAVSRAIGDNDSELKESGVCSDAAIDITDMKQICRALQLDQESIGRVQIISTCDGFTDGALAQQSKRDHEVYLLKCLGRLASPGSMPEDRLATALAKSAYDDGSMDNISVAVQTIIGKPVFVGVYDGHNGNQASCYVAENIGKVFKEQCALSREAYSRQAFSVNCQADVYQRDNECIPDLDIIVNDLQVLTEDYLSHSERHFAPETPIVRITERLAEILNGNQLYRDKIKAYYDYLNEDSSVSGLTNIQVIQQDTSMFAVNLLKFVAIIVATIATLILPALLVMVLFNSITGQQPLDLLKGNGERFEKETNLIKERISFFKSEPSDSQDNVPIPAVVLSAQ